MFTNWLNDEEGQALAEYGLLIAIVAIAIAGLAVIFRNKLAGVFQKATGDLANQANAPVQPN